MIRFFGRSIDGQSLNCDWRLLSCQAANVFSKSFDDIGAFIRMRLETCLRKLPWWQAV